MLSVLDVHHGQLGPPGKGDHDVLVGVEAAEDEPAPMQVQDGAVGEWTVSRFDRTDGLDSDTAERDPADPQAPARAEALKSREPVDAATDRGEAVLDGSISLVGN